MLGRKNDKTIISSVWKRMVFVFVFYVPAKRVGRTFLKAILALPEYHTNMRAWLYKVARNLFYNLYKRNRREICDEEYLKKISKLEVDEFLEEYISKQETRILYTAMQKLSPVKREVLELQYFGQMPLKEIANVLQLSQENVRVLSHRAKKI